MGIREREAKSIAERKKHLVSILADVATVGAERMSEKIGKAGLRDAVIGTGMAVDKMLALTSQMPSVNIANISLPSEEAQAAREATHDRLDEIVQLLRETRPKPLSLRGRPLRVSSSVAGTLPGPGKFTAIRGAKPLLRSLVLNVNGLINNNNGSTGNSEFTVVSRTMVHGNPVQTIATLEVPFGMDVR